jgi:tetratricopeptide (TPR) repeat protein
VVSPSGEDRHGKIWGGLVPWGIYDLGFNGRRGPWRAGANENTVFTVSHPVKVQGQPLAAGRYGLHMIAGEKEFTVIFSKNSTSWGSFSYDEAEDALRVRSVPEKAPFREWLTYEFLERKPDRATVALEWEELRVPFTIEVEDAPALYVDNLRKELRDAPGFTWQAWNAAAQYCLQANRNLEEALRWADNAVSEPFVGQENFTTLSTLSRLQRMNGLEAEATKTFDRAINHPGATPIQLHMAARQLMTDGDKAQALRVFQLNAKRFPNQWPVHVGLMRAYAATGEKKKALEEAKLAIAQAPDDANRKNLEGLRKRLEEGQEIE